MKKQKRLTDEEISPLIETISLNLVHIGSDETNFKILMMIPSDIKTIMKETGLTKVPINIRINTLEKYGLVKRQKGVGTVTAGLQLAMFLGAYEKFEKMISANVYEYVLNMDLNAKALSKILAKG